MSKPLSIAEISARLAQEIAPVVAAALDAHARPGWLPCSAWGWSTRSARRLASAHSLEIAMLRGKAWLRVAQVDGLLERLAIEPRSVEAAAVECADLDPVILAAANSTEKSSRSSPDRAKRPRGR